MVNFCAVYGCGSRGDRVFSTYLRVFITKASEHWNYPFPAEKWLAALLREDLKPENYAYYRVCGDHFSKGKASHIFYLGPH